MIYTVNYDTLNDYWSINFPKNLDRPQIFSTKQPGLDLDLLPTQYGLGQVEVSFTWFGIQYTQIMLYVYFSDDSISLKDALEQGQRLIWNYLDKHYPYIKGQVNE